MTSLTASPSISKIVKQIRDFPEDRHSHVLSPIEKECVDRMVDNFMKSPVINLYLKFKVSEKLALL